MWAGLNLTAEYLASRSTAPSRPREHRYPLAMVRAIVMVWHYAEMKLVGCIRWQSRTGLLPETDAAISNEAICFLDIPTNKTGTAFTKPVDRVVGEAIKEWERIRPTQPPTVDAKTGELVDYLFTYRGYGVSISNPAFCTLSVVLSGEGRNAVR